MAQILHDADLVGEIGRELRPVEGESLEAVDFLVEEGLAVGVLQEEFLDASEPVRYLLNFALDGQALLRTAVEGAACTAQRACWRFALNLR